MHKDTCPCCGAQSRLNETRQKVEALTNVLRRAKEELEILERAVPAATHNEKDTMYRDYNPDILGV